MSRRIFSVKVFATSLCSKAFSTTLSDGEENCKLKAIIKFKNKSGICSSMSVSGGYSMLSRRNVINWTPKKSKMHDKLKKGKKRKIKINYLSV